MSELVVKQPFLDCQVGQVNFYNYEEMLEQATHLAELIRTVEVDEESIKGTKKLLAEVNKRVDALEAERIRIKKELLEPYMAFEAKIKTITGVVKESDNELRGKVRALEELEREEKRKVIENIFHKRLDKYPRLFFLTPSHFINPSHLNKTTVLNKVETAMAQFFEQVSREFEMLLEQDGDLKHYADTLDFIGSMPKKVEPMVDTPKNEWVAISVPESELPQVHLFLKMNRIPYKQN
ncbi:DUF1351 domain-containing protein [Paenibacillus sp. Soil724D2]|uniref:DUF1351 domain-containing protein n=1 Tax=Paenibacillus sp. (strain Soil724D2) TaxID=1736392 RepID=UPI000713D93C|nr:DUF1351 domain-containing protein [Paenibacillus sp. Soil724D2]KRE33447.1 hypothetical protein ASG85_14365 [Paenibacillus sp. Soil724D2]